MKTNKALKRLAKIKAMIADVTKRYSANAPQLRDVLLFAEDAVTRAKEAVGLQASSKTKAKTKAKKAKAGRAERRSAPSQKRADVKGVAASSSKSKTAKKSAPVKKASKKSAPKKRPTASVTPVVTVSQ